ncbi:hypothetical protein FisN_14Lh152 [Fistulifera solaris]|uniref:Uncharacterized protein n=1 Tax=Fistulifera solaris TaxID=1519565 RepID=A0A1Z5J9L5_FISSO|nr:hypothetical protein FisN_14Lh152 [Fistulifera solaris]|eukprot:GAX10646.1 hypothetical protein FisN_14Lh152 [Fistulifera solaris]
MYKFIKENDERYGRILAEESVRVDYSVLSVGVMTLGLIMIVEVVRHKIDHAAGQRPFPKAVIQGVYSELATLGIVELLLFMLSKYYTDLDKEKYLVFADIHFALFYTAILNAFQSVILAVVSHRVARQIWVETEMLELSHYVEIREEFDQVKAAMKEMGAQSDLGLSSREIQMDEDDSAFTTKRFFRSFMDRFRYPTLRRKYNELLIQVRFHELRVHFLQAYNLPLTLKVSDYLLESQQHVLLKLVHVSSIAWTLLTGAVNVMYYVLGIVSYKVSDSTIVGTALIWIFFWSMALFVVIAAVVYRKMESIFKKIMVDKTLWGLIKQQGNLDQLREQQLSLFYGSDPKLVIAAIQFMQFGYAVNLSVVIIFWQEIDDGRIPMVVYLLVIAVCYTVFVHVTARVIPQYTLCTNLGQLVDEKRLHETLAAFLLEESRRQEADEKIANKHPQKPMNSGEKSEDHTLNEETSQSDLSEVKPTTLSRTISNRSVSNALLMAELVKLDTNSLRMNLPTEERNKITFRQMERTSRRGRQKSLSEGIATMIAMGNMPLPNHSSKPDQVKDDSFIPHSVEWKKANYRSQDSETLKAEDTLRDSLIARRRRSHRLKTVSDGVAAMTRMQANLSVNGLSPVPEFHNGYSSTRRIPSPVVTKLSSISLSNDVHNKMDTDQLSVHSDGGHSDIDDVPEVEPAKESSYLPTPATSLRKRFKKFTLSKKYIVLSNVFGTLVAFFLVGQRVESFLHSEGIVSEKFVSFDFNNEHTFWALFVLFALFCVVDCAILTTLNPFGQQDQPTGEMKALVAALLDFLLMSTCLILFIVAEVKRCCTSIESEGLASDSISSFNALRLLAAEPENDEDYFNTAAPCSCPKFGHRAYSGLGTIEPFTALVGLRIFRHWAAGLIVKRILSLNHGKVKEKEIIERISADPFAVFDDSTRNRNFFGKSHDLPCEEIRGTAAELWKAAVGEHPEVARKYGEFSSEILKIMLGMSLSELGNGNQGILLNESSRLLGLGDDASSSFTLQNRHATQVSKTHETSITGPAGKTSVKVTSAFESIGHKSNPDDEETSTPPAVFQKDDLVASSNKIPSEIVFRSPGAQLVRSMRRCDRKLLPILNRWTVVDVVLTRFEIVYFEILNADEAAKRDDPVRKVLKATKGGKGLRLCDVAKGRRIIGRLEISEIESMTVQRHIGTVDTADNEKIRPDTDVWAVEYWKDAPVSSVQFSRPYRWNQIRDQLHIKTIHGRTLCLRFYSDLERTELGANRVTNNAAIDKNNAFQWVQTIGRFCGRDQLKQHLPHFGDGTDDELRDYLVEQHDAHEEIDKMGPRRGSTGDLRGLLGKKSGKAENTDSPMKRSFRMSFPRLSSLEELDHAKNGDTVTNVQTELDAPVQLVDVNTRTTQVEFGDAEDAIGVKLSSIEQGIVSTRL